ncbi:MAG: hypothetical protein IJG50_07580 [Clostridia bacterium]|nr:hypothetical protein [Clostridia bacterium]
MRQTREEKALVRELRELYGGAMTLADITREIGAVKPATGKKWAQDLPAVRINGRLRWRVTDVARKLYESREVPLETELKKYVL